MSWIDVENAVQRAFVMASQLADQRVTWAYQDVNEPAQTHVVLNFGGDVVVGLDRVQITTDLTRPNGQEIKMEVKGVREVPLEVEVFTDDTSGDYSARRLADQIRTRLVLPSVRDTMARVGVTPFDPGPINWIPDPPVGRYRGRAHFTVRCYAPVMDAFEYVGYIARVKGMIFPVGWRGVSGVSGFAFDSGATNYGR